MTEDELVVRIWGVTRNEVEGFDRLTRWVADPKRFERLYGVTAASMRRHNRRLCRKFGLGSSQAGRDRWDALVRGWDLDRPLRDHPATALLPYIRNRPLPPLEEQAQAWGRHRGMGEEEVEEWMRAHLPNDPDADPD